MSVNDVHLYGRDHELASLDLFVRQVQDGAGGLVAVCGGAGTGKTALLAAAGSRMAAAGHEVLRARGLASEATLPFGLAWRLVEPCLDRLAGPVRAALAGLRPGDATVLDPARGDAPPPPDATLPQMHALNHAVMALAAQTPLLIAVDDLHWADRPSLRWVATLPQRLERTAAGLLVSVGNGESCADEELLDEVLAAASMHLNLAGLGMAAGVLVEAVVGHSPDPAFTQACLHLTDGNPLLLTCLARQVSEQGVMPTAEAAAGLGDIDVPGLAAVVHVWLRRVSPIGLALARTVAVLGEDVTLGRVADLVGAGLLETAETVAALDRRGVFRLSGDAITFAQPLVRSAIVRELPVAALRGIHTQAAKILHDSGADAGRVADQLLAATPLGEPWVPRLLREAAHRALATGAPDSAVTYLRRALAEPVQAGLAQLLMGELGVAEARVDLPAAARHLTSALSGQGDPTVSADVLAEACRVLSLTGQHEAALETVRAAPEHPWLDQQGRETELLLAQQVSVAAAAQALDRLRVPREETLAGTPRLVSLAAVRETWAGTSRPRAERLARQCLAAGPVVPDDMAAFLRAARVLADAGHLGDASQSCDEAVEAASQWDHRPWLATALSARAVIGRRLGNLAQAAADARSGVDLLLDCGLDRRDEAVAEVSSAYLHVLIDKGCLDEARQLLERAGMTVVVPDGWAGLSLLLARGRLHAAEGHDAHALRDLLACGKRAAAWGVDNPAVVPWRSEAVLPLYRTRRVATAQRVAAEGTGQARAWGATGPLAAALRVHAQVVGGPWGRATLEEAVSVVTGTLERLELIQCLTAYGTSLGQGSARRMAEARHALRDAFNLAHECGSPALAGRAATGLAAYGGRRLQAPKRGVASLTAAEFRVAELAAAGQRNREIAKTLYLAKRTVEIHLTSTYRKLRISGREQLAAAMAADGPGGPSAAGRSPRPPRVAGPTMGTPPSPAAMPG